ncbi:MAG: AidA/PixA family protein [Chloroflexota bacterium]
MAEIDILCVIDGQTLMELSEQSGWNNTTSDNPRRFNHGSDIQPYLRMITRTANAGLNTQATAELQVNANKDDRIRWRATSLTEDTNYSVEIVKFTYIDSYTVISNPEHNSYGNFWEAKAVGPGEESYWIVFKVMSRDHNKVRYFDWDPKVVVS